MKMVNKPYIILSAAMTIDGKIASKEGDTDISDDRDWKEVHRLRTKVDAIMVGKNTIMADNPKLHIKFYSHSGYYRIVVDSNLTIPIDSNVIIYKPDLYPTIICTTENVPIDQISEYKAKNVKIITSGQKERVDINAMLLKLYQMGIRSILLEGGGNLNWSFIKENLVDEIRLTIAPWIIGGQDAISLVEGDGFSRIKDAPQYHLSKVKARNNYVKLKFLKMS
jgi:2,5-diamino-6-(ribosylamino)-4(3H)-pyrimidinone 5'-phosphate reductase